MIVDSAASKFGPDNSAPAVDESAPPAYDAVYSKGSTTGYAPSTAGTSTSKEKEASPYPTISFPVPEPYTEDAPSPSSSNPPYYAPSTLSASTASSPIDSTSPSSIFSSPHTLSTASSSTHSPMRSRSTASSTSTSTSTHTRTHSLAEDPNRPPPESFDRPPPKSSLEPFPPATHYANSDDLTQGFPLTPPTCPCAPAPHPFMTHDVTESDWTRFLADVQNAGGLKAVNAFLANAAPRVVTTGFIGAHAEDNTGYLASKAIKAHVKGKRKSPVAEVIELWNRRFFHPRCMDVVLAQGSMTYTGPVSAQPADLVRPAPARTRKAQGVTVVEDHSDDEGDGTAGVLGASAGAGLSAVGAAVGGVYSRFGRGGRERRGRVEFGLDLKHSAGERRRLVVAYKPPVL